MLRGIVLSTALVFGAGLAPAMAAPAIETPAPAAAEAELQGYQDPLHAWVRESIAAVKTGSAEVVFESPQILSVLRHDPGYAPPGAKGAGPVWLVPVNWDRKEQALIPIEAVLGDPSRDAEAYARAAELLRAAIVEAVWAGSPGEWAEAIETEVQPDPMYLSTFTFTPSTVPQRIGGIAWHFGPAMIAPADRGVVSVVLPQADLRPVVQARWLPLFEGEPAGTLNARSAAPVDVSARTGS